MLFKIYSRYKHSCCVNKLFYLGIYFGLILLRVEYCDRMKLKINLHGKLILERKEFFGYLI